MYRHSRVMPTAEPSPATVRDYQDAVTRKPAAVFSDAPTQKEWRTEFGAIHYSPRLDIAVGPFATGSLRLESAYNRMAVRHHDLLQALHSRHRHNVDGHGGPNTVLEFDQMLEQNPNARCFLAIEIENKVTRKHLMGGALNASSLGRIAVVVGWTPDKVKALVKLRSYMLLLGRVGKPSFDASNLLILAPDQLWTELTNESLSERLTRR